MKRIESQLESLILLNASKMILFFQKAHEKLGISRKIKK